ncbi:MAG: diaminopimelate epimerase [Bryobacteraceae bacterium]
MSSNPIRVPFTKAHGAQNDFLLTWDKDAPAAGRESIARAICHRYTGIGADGWMLVSPETSSDADAAIQLYNSDGSVPEISGNGTRCAAALLIHHGLAAETVRIRTGAGIKTLRLLRRHGLDFEFEMDMGRPTVLDAAFQLPLAGGPREVVLLNVGNPQCVVPVRDFDFDWRAMGAQIERHPQFPNRTNVSFIRALDEHTVEAVFWERGAGETMSSGTGSTGAAAAAVARGIAQSPVTVKTPAGPIGLRLTDSAYLTGPAALTGEGLYFLCENVLGCLKQP